MIVLRSDILDPDSILSAAEQSLRRFGRADLLDGKVYEIKDCVMGSKHTLAKSGLVRMSHISIHVANLDRAISFYEKYFGFQIILDRTLEGAEFERITGASPGAKSRMVRGLIAGNSVIQLFAHNWREPAALGGLVSFEVRDVREAHSALTQAGIACRSEPQEFDNCWAFVTYDPEGTSIELVQWKPHADPYMSVLPE